MSNRSLPEHLDPETLRVIRSCTWCEERLTYRDGRKRWHLCEFHQGFDEGADTVRRLLAPEHA